MLNLLKLDLDPKINTKITNEDKRKSCKHFPSATREWDNSIYVYNKNTINLVPTTTQVSNKIIKSYFNLFNNKIERKIRRKRLIFRFRRLSSNKIYISNAEFKHTNNKVLINLYIFNRQKNNYILTLKKWYIRNFFKKIYKLNFNRKFINKLQSLNKKCLLNIKDISKQNFNESFNLISIPIISKFYKYVLIKSMRKLYIYIYYKKLLYINNSKLNYTYLQLLKKYLEKLYNKNVEFNLVNLKRFYLNSDILSEAITLKLTKNRRKMLKFMNKLKNKIKVKSKKIFSEESSLEKSLVIKNLTGNVNTLNYFIVNSLKYRHVTGFRLEARGRLTRRFTASRSTNKLRYKGNLLDIDSSYKGLSSVLLKGNLKSNLQYTKLSSKTRIGSFGIKGWISGN